MMWSFIFIVSVSIWSKDFLFANSIVDLNSLLVMMILVSFVSMLSLFFMEFCGNSFLGGFVFKSLFSLLVLFVSLSFLVCDPFLFLLCLELTVLPMSFIMINLGKDYDKIPSLMFMLFFNLFGSIPFMIFALNCSFDSLMFLTFDGAASFLNSPFIFFSFFIVVVSKIPVFFMHFWLTKAHVSASGAASMILASLMLKLGTYGVLKYHKKFIYLMDLFSGWFFSFGAVSSLLILLIMLRSLDIKYLIACSSILHMSMIFPCAFFGSGVSLSFSIFMSVAHGLVSYFLFFLVSLLYESSLNRSWELNSSLESATKSISMFIFIFLVLNLGFPPFLNFIGEVLLCCCILKFSLACLAPFCLTLVVSILFCMIFVIKILFGKINIFSPFHPYINLELESMVYILFLLAVPFFL